MPAPKASPNTPSPTIKNICFLVKLLSVGTAGCGAGGATAPCTGKAAVTLAAGGVCTDGPAIDPIGGGSMGLMTGFGGSGTGGPKGTDAGVPAPGITLFIGGNWSSIEQLHK